MHFNHSKDDVYDYRPTLIIEVRRTCPVGDGADCAFVLAAIISAIIATRNLRVVVMPVSTITAG
jgi:hypothetical protein